MEAQITGRRQHRFEADMNIDMRETVELSD